MAEITSTNDTRYLSSVTTSAKRALPNVSSGWIVMVLSGLFAAVIFLFATAQGGSKYSVAVITRHIEPGQTISLNSVREEKINVGKAQLDRMVAFKGVAQYNGWVASTALEPGDIVMKSMLLQPATSNGLSEMSIPVDRSHAVNGDLHDGDKIDIIDSSATPSAYVAQGIQVLDVNSSGGGALGGVSQFSISVAVDSQTAARLSATIKNDKFDIIRSTGASSSTASTTSAATPTP